MGNAARRIFIHMADDDDDDRLMFEEAVQESRILNKPTFTVDSQDLLDYLRRQGQYADLDGEPLPDLILLDLNMPRMGGIEALKEIKADPALKRIPILILTTSSAEQDIVSTYDIGANSFITKPITFEGLVEAVKTMTNYWFEIVRLPGD